MLSGHTLTLWAWPVFRSKRVRIPKYSPAYTEPPSGVAEMYPASPPPTACQSARVIAPSWLRLRMATEELSCCEPYSTYGHWSSTLTW